MFTSKANLNLREVMNGGKMSDDTLKEILSYMNSYNREEYYVSATGISGEKFFLYDSEPSTENFHITKESILKSINN